MYPAPHTRNADPPVSEINRARARLVSNGWRPVPVMKGTKASSWGRWTAWLDPSSPPPTEHDFESWCASGYTSTGVGLFDGPGGTVAVDLDIDDPAWAASVYRVAETVFGRTPFVRYRARSPRVAMLYRLDGSLAIRHGDRAGKFSFPGMSKPFGIEVLTDERQILVDGIHPETRSPWLWVEGSSPFDLPHNAAPVITAAKVHQFFGELGKLGVLPIREARVLADGSYDEVISEITWVDGKAVDGRDGLIMRLALDFARLHPDDEQTVLAKTWGEVQRLVNLDIPKGADGTSHWSYEDVARKVHHRMKFVSDHRNECARDAYTMFGPPTLSPALPSEDPAFLDFLKTLEHEPVFRNGSGIFHPDETRIHLTGLAMQNEVTVHVQPSGTGKTTIYASLGVAAKYGWVNHRHPNRSGYGFGYKSHPKTSIVFVAVEGASSIHSTCKAFLIDNGLAGEGVEPVRKDAFVILDMGFSQNDGLWVKRGRYPGDPATLNTPLWLRVERTIQNVRRLNPEGPLVLVMDNILAMVGAEAVTSGDDVIRELRAQLDRMMRRDGNMSTVLIHHTNKDRKTEMGHQQLYNMLADRFLRGFRNPENKDDVYLMAEKQRSLHVGFTYIRLKAVRLPEAVTQFPGVNADDEDYRKRVLNYAAAGAYVDEIVISAPPPDWLVKEITGKAPSRSIFGGTGDAPVPMDSMTRDTTARPQPVENTLPDWMRKEMLR